MQLRHRSLLVTTLSFALLLSATPANSATIAGTKCTKVGATKTISAKKYTCVKSGKKLIWNQGVAISSSSASTTSAAVQKQLGARMAIVSGVQLLADKLWNNSQGIKLDPPTFLAGKNAALINNQTGAKSARQMIMSFSPMFPNFDMNDLPVENVIPSNQSYSGYLQGAHGTAHMAQKFFASTAGGVDENLIPTWFREGTAMVIATMAVNEQLKKNPNYATIVSKYNFDWKSESCKAQYEKWRIDNTADQVVTNTCAYGLGQLMAEVLVNKTNALDPVLMIYQLVAIGDTFDNSFAFAFGYSKADFFNEMDSYLTSLK